MTLSALKNTAIYLMLFITAISSTAMAQTARKPSSYNTHTELKKKVSREPSLIALRDRASFDRMARVYDPGTSLETPHVLFAIDRYSKADGNGMGLVHYINSRRYTFHEDYVRQQKMVPANMSNAEMNKNYERADRRFIFGIVSYQPVLQRWVWELWEGDPLPAPLITLTQKALQSTFFETLTFKTNSSIQEDNARHAGVEFVTQAAVVSEQSWLPLNTGERSGRLRFFDDMSDATDLQPYDIVVLKQVPLSLPPVSGVITRESSTVLSHVNLLAKGWGIPNAYVRDAAERWQSYEGQWVKLKVSRTDIQLTADPAAPSRWAKTHRRVQSATKSRATVKPVVISQRMDLMPLSRLRAKDHQHCGSKAANLGEIAWAIDHQRVTNVGPVPDGFCIPYAQYVEFITQPDVKARIEAAEATPGFDRDPDVRKQALAALRHDLETWPTAYRMEQTWVKQWQAQLQSDGVFVRSSSNSEDLPGFSGAGLFTTVPHVKDAQSLVKAVHTVWASVFNDEAYEARRVSRIGSAQVAMGVFVQRAVNSQASGVMVTLDPFDPHREYSVYISAKRGLGIKVVEGRRVAEQVLYDRFSKAVQVLTRSAEDTELKLNAEGGVVEVPIDPQGQRAVLTDELVARLATAGHDLQMLFGNRHQDIEWAVDGQGQLIILQSRPFIGTSQ